MYLKLVSNHPKVYFKQHFGEPKCELQKPSFIYYIILFISYYFLTRKCVEFSTVSQLNKLSSYFKIFMFGNAFLSYGLQTLTAYKRHLGVNKDRTYRKRSWSGARLSICARSTRPDRVCTTFASRHDNHLQSKETGRLTHTHRKPLLIVGLDLPQSELVRCPYARH